MLKEYIKCDFCGCDESKLRYVVKGFHIVQCKRCGLVYVNPRQKIVATSFQELYENMYHQYIDQHDFKRAVSRTILRRIDKYRDLRNKSAEGGRLLEIGCSIGSLLVEATTFGYKAEGVEFAQWACEIARNRFGLSVQNGRFEDINMSKELFDVVIFNEVIEHVTSPRQFLKKIAQVLSPGGLISFTTGNLWSLESAIYGSRWYYLTPAYHLYFFSPRTISAYLRELNFKVLSISTPVSLKNVWREKRAWGNWYRVIRAMAGKIHIGPLTLKGNMGVIARKQK